MAGNPMGRNGMVRPGPHTGSTFAGGSYSPNRRMTMPTPTSTNTSPPAPAAGSMPGQRNGWNGAALPPGLMQQLQRGNLNARWTPIAQAAGLMPAAGATAPAAPATGGAPTHAMPDGSMMPGASHPAASLPLQAQVPMPSFMPPGLMRPGQGRRTVMPQPYPQQLPKPQEPVYGFEPWLTPGNPMYQDPRLLPDYMSPFG
jgi:hypothetical protein